jgi:hypothetical protein
MTCPSPIGTFTSLYVLQQQRCNTNGARSECCTWGVAHDEKGNNKEGISQWGDNLTREELMQQTSQQGGWLTKSDLPEEAFLDKEWHIRSGSREVVLGFDWGSSLMLQKWWDYHHVYQINTKLIFQMEKYYYGEVFSQCDHTYHQNTKKHYNIVWIHHKSNQRIIDGFAMMPVKQWQCENHVFVGQHNGQDLRFRVTGVLLLQAS